MYCFITLLLTFEIHWIILFKIAFHEMRAIMHCIANSFYQIVVRFVGLRGEFRVSYITLALFLSTSYIRCLASLWKHVKLRVRAWMDNLTLCSYVYVFDWIQIPLMHNLLYTWQTYTLSELTRASTKRINAVIRKRCVCNYIMQTSKPNRFQMQP